MLQDMPREIFNVRIRRNVDGVIHEDKQDLPVPFSDFIWADGNYACDCNRELFFFRAVGEEDPDNACSHDRYSVQIVDRAGNIVYSDFDEIAG